MVTVTRSRSLYLNYKKTQKTFPGPRSPPHWHPCHTSKQGSRSLAPEIQTNVFVTNATLKAFREMSIMKSILFDCTSYTERSVPARKNFGEKFSLSSIRLRLRMIKKRALVRGKAVNQCSCNAAPLQPLCFPILNATAVLSKAKSCLVFKDWKTSIRNPLQNT